MEGGEEGRKEEKGEEGKRDIEEGEAPLRRTHTHTLHSITVTGAGSSGHIISTHVHVLCIHFDSGGFFFLLYDGL